MKEVLFLIVLMISFNVFAATTEAFHLDGYVLSFDEKKVTIESGNQKVEVPRKYYSEKVKIGERISIPTDEITAAQFKTEQIKNK